MLIFILFPVPMNDRLHTVRMIRKAFICLMLFPSSLLLMIASSIVTVTSIWTDLVLWIAGEDL